MEPSKSTENLHSSGNDGGNKVLIIVVVIALVVAAIALIIAIVSISGNGKQNITVASAGGGASGGSTSGQTGSGSGDERIWQFAFEDTGNNYIYIDEASGELRGFQVDLTLAVCQIAGKNCELVFDSPGRCWDSIPGARPQGGEGLMVPYYDTCMGWVQSYDRLRTFKFSLPFSTPVTAVLFVKKNNPRGFDWTNLTGKKLGFIEGWAYDEHCIARVKDSITGWDLGVEQVVRYSDRQTLYDGLQAEEVDAVFDNIDSWIGDDTTIGSDPITSCAKAGISNMMRKDNQLDIWWNDAFNKLKATSQWKTICNDLTQEHGHISGPNPEEFCLDYPQ